MTMATVGLKARGEELMLHEGGLEAFRRRFSGTLVRPGEHGYDAARAVCNGMIDRRPALIAYCTNRQDVIEAIAFARATGILTAIRSGGHNIAGSSLCDGGLVIDLSRMNRVTVDPISRTARAEGGALLADLDGATQVHALATTTGVNSDTGLIGLTLGGGIGRLGRKHGLSCDNMLSAEIVTADGQVLNASEDENAELFWGLRGGGGNFGIVTAITYRLHPLGPTVLAGSLVYEWKQVHDALRLYAEFSAAAPDALCMDAALITTPDGKPGFRSRPSMLDRSTKGSVCSGRCAGHLPPSVTELAPSRTCSCKGQGTRRSRAATASIGRRSFCVRSPKLRPNRRLQLLNGDSRAIFAAPAKASEAPSYQKRLGAEQQCAASHPVHLVFSPAPSSSTARRGPKPRRDGSMKRSPHSAPATRKTWSGT